MSTAVRVRPGGSDDLPEQDAGVRAVPPAARAVDAGQGFEIGVAVAHMW
jgi:hypothetical protein